MSMPGPAVAAPRARFVPNLRLGTETVFVDRGRATEEVRAAAMRLDFAYEGVKVRAGDPCRNAYAMGGPGEAPRVITRDTRGEAEARRVLEALGAIEIDAL